MKKRQRRNSYETDITLASFAVKQTDTRQDFGEKREVLRNFQTTCTIRFSWQHVPAFTALYPLPFSSRRSLEPRYSYRSFLTARDRDEARRSYFPFSQSKAKLHLGIAGDRRVKTKREIAKQPDDSSQFRERETERTND